MGISVSSSAVHQEMIARREKKLKERDQNRLNQSAIIEYNDGKTKTMKVEEPNIKRRFVETQHLPQVSTQNENADYYYYLNKEPGLYERSVKRVQTITPTRNGSANDQLIISQSGYPSKIDASNKSISRSKKVPKNKKK